MHFLMNGSSPTGDAFETTEQIEFLIWFHTNFHVAICWECGARIGWRHSFKTTRTLAERVESPTENSIHMVPTFFFQSELHHVNSCNVWKSDFFWHFWEWFAIFWREFDSDLTDLWGVLIVPHTLWTSAKQCLPRQSPGLLIPCGNSVLWLVLWSKVWCFFVFLPLKFFESFLWLSPLER